MLGTRLLVIAAVMLGGGCRRDRPVVSLDDARLLGHRVVLEEPSRLRYQFDRNRRPRVWLPAEAGGPWQLTWNDTALPTIFELRAKGVLLVAQGTADPPAGNGRLRVVGQSGSEKSWLARWAPAPADFESIARAQHLRREGKLDQAAATLADAIAAQSDWHQLWALMARAGDLRLLGQPHQATALWQRAADLARSKNAPSIAAWSWRSNAYVAFSANDLSAATQWLDRVERLGPDADGPVGVAKLHYNRGLIENALGDLHAAKESLEQAYSQANTWGEDGLALIAGEMYADVLQRLGRFEQALALYHDRLTPLAGDPPPGRFLSNRAWLLLQAKERGIWTGSNTEIEELLLAARAALQAERDAPMAAIAGLNLAWLHYRSEQWPEARQRLADDFDLARAGQHRAFAEMLHAELLVRDRDLPLAQRAFEKAEASARAHGSDVAWRAALGLARLWKKRQRPKKAAAAYQRALGHVERLGEGTGIQSDRAAFFADRDQLYGEAVSALLELGMIQEALWAADAGHARVLRALAAPLRISQLSAAAQKRWTGRVRRFLDLGDQLDALHQERALLFRPADRAGWQRRADALQARQRQAFDANHQWLGQQAGQPATTQFRHDELEPNHALLLLSETPIGLLAFWARKSGLQAQQVSDHPLAPWRTQLAKIDHLYIVASGLPLAQSLGEYTIAATSRPLAATVGISYLPYAALLGSPTYPAKNPAVVVANPTGDLPHAAKEGKAIAQQTNASLIQGSRASRAAVLLAIQETRLFHFAGHGKLRGQEPWDAHLRLAQDGTLAIEDLLMARPHARVVVLNGCDTGARIALSAREVIGLPEAFLASGSEAVLATRRPVQDDEAARFIRRFYAHHGDRAPKKAMRLTIAEFMAVQDVTWKAFLLWAR